MPWIHSDSQEEDSEEDDEEGDEDDEDDDEEDDEEDDASVESSEPRAYSVLSDIRGEEPGDLSVQVHNTVCPGTQHCLSRYTTLSVQRVFVTNFQIVISYLMHDLCRFRVECGVLSR